MAADFFVLVRRPVLFLLAVFFDALFLLAPVELFFEALFLEAVFFFEALFLCGFGGMFAPDRRASLKPIAIACLGFLTVFPLRPDSSSWCLYSCIVFCILLCTILFDFGPDPEDVFFPLLFFLVGTSVLEYIRTAQLLLTGWQSDNEMFQFKAHVIRKTSASGVR